MINNARSSEHLIAIIGFNNSTEVSAAAIRFAGLPGMPDVVVIENGQAIYGKEIEVFRSVSNVGYCEAANRAVSLGLERGYSTVSVANADIDLSEESFAALLAVLPIINDRVAVIGGVELDERGIVRTAGGRSWSPWTGTDRWDKRVPSACTSVLFVQGAFVTFTRSILQLKPVFRDSLFMYFDEVDLGLRLRAVGLECLLVPALTFSHDNEAGRYRLLRGYLMHRNRALVVHAYSGWAAPIAHAVGLGQLILGIVARFPRMRAAYAYCCLRGWADGVRGLVDNDRIPGRI